MTARKWIWSHWSLPTRQCLAMPTRHYQFGSTKHFFIRKAIASSFLSTFVIPLNCLEIHDSPSLLEILRWNFFLYNPPDSAYGCWSHRITSDPTWSHHQTSSNMLILTHCRRLNSLNRFTFWQIAERWPGAFWVGNFSLIAILQPPLIGLLALLCLKY